MSKWFIRVSWVALVALASQPASAQVVQQVMDRAAIAKAIETARNTLEQIKKAEEQIRQAQQLYNSMNGISNVGDVGNILNSELLQSALPTDIAKSVDLVSTDLSELGSIGNRAEDILAGRNIVGAADGALQSMARVAARDQAVAELQLGIADREADGIVELKDRLRTSSTLKETADLQARASLETAQLINQMNQREALKDAQLAAQRIRAAEYTSEQNEKAKAELRAGVLPKITLPRQ